MPRNKDLKRLVRARMKKTGEAYTAALSNIKTRPGNTKPHKAAGASASRSGSAARAATTEYAEIAGMSDERIKEKTGCDWERWVYALDRHKAAEMPHREIAALISDKYKVPGWWTQTVAVGYERIKGLRVRGQRRDGSYEAGKSRTFAVPVAELFDAWADAGVRRRWLDTDVKVRTKTPPRTMRLGWPDGTIVVVGFTPKGKAKSSVTIAHTKVPDRGTAQRLKRYWSDRFDSLGEVLSNGG